MAVGFVASASSGSQASVASFNISASLGTGARCGIVFVVTHNNATAKDTGVTWNGVAMSLLYSATDTDTEPGVVRAYFLDNVSNGAVTVSRTNDAVVTVGYAASISASIACQAYQTITRVSSTQNTNADTSTTGTGASGEVAVDDGSPGSSSMRFAAYWSGAATPPAQGTNSTALQVLDSTAYGSRFVRETTAGQGSRNVGAATGTTDDWALVAVAVRENNRNASIVNTGGGVLAATSAGAHTSSPVNTGGGVAAVAKTTSRSTSAVATGGGVAVATTLKGGQLAASATGGGVLATATQKGGQTSAVATGGGVAVIDGVATVIDNRDASIALTGGGVAAIAATGAHAPSVTATGAGVAVLDAPTQRTGAVVATGGGVAAVTQATARSASAAATGGGVAAVDARSGRILAAQLSGGGVLTYVETTARSASPVATGGGVVVVDAVAEVGSDNRNASITATGGGVPALDVATQRAVAAAATASGQATVSVQAAHQLAVAMTGAGVATIDGTTDRQADVGATGGGVVVIDGSSAAAPGLLALMRIANGSAGRAPIGAVPPASLISVSDAPIIRSSRFIP